MNQHMKFKIATAKKKKPKHKPIASTFEAREGTTAICRMTTGDMAAGVLFHAILEMWVEAKKKVSREGRDWLFLSGADLQTMSGLTKFEVRDRAIPRLKECPFFEIGRGRITRSSPNVYQIRFDQDEFWNYVMATLDPTIKVKETTPDTGEYVQTKKVVDRTKLPYLFKRLYDAVSVDG